MYWMLWLSDRSCGISIGVFRHFSEILWILFEAFFANFCLVLLIFRVFLFSNFRKKNRKNWKFFVFFFDHWRFYSLPHIFPWNSKKYLCNLNFFNILFKISHEFPFFQDQRCHLKAFKSTKSEIKPITKSYDSHIHTFGLLLLLCISFQRFVHCAMSFWAHLNQMFGIYHSILIKRTFHFHSNEIWIAKFFQFFFFDKILYLNFSNFHWFNCRLPFNTRGPMGFNIAILIDMYLCWTFLIGSVAFVIVYVSICTFFKSCIDDLATIISTLDANMPRSRSVENKLKQFIELHLKCYRWVINRFDFHFVDVGKSWNIIKFSIQRGCDAWRCD